MPPPDTARSVASPAEAPARPSPRAAPVEPPRTGRLRAIGRWWAARPTLAAAAIYAGLALVFVGQGLLPGRTLSSADYQWNTTPWQSSRPADVRPFGANFEPADAVVVFHPFFNYAREAFPDLPLWNPHVMGGRPFLANAQSALLSPFTFPAYVLPLNTALGVMALLKLFVGAFGMYLLGRALGMRFGGALLSGLVFAFSTYFTSWLPWPLSNIYPLLPWLLLLVELLVRRPGPVPALGLGVLVALQFFGGHPETNFHVMCFLVCWFAFRLVVHRRGMGLGRRGLLRPTAAFAAALVGGTAMAAVTLLPLAELFLNSADYVQRLDREPTYTNPRWLGAYFLNDYWGRPTQAPIEAFVTNRGLYAGGLTLMLAAVALILRPTFTRVVLAGFGALVLATAVGVQPFFGLLIRLPGFETAHNGRIVVFVLVVLALLAGWGLDELTSRAREPGRRRTLALAAAGVVFCVPIAWMLVAGTLELGQLRRAFAAAWLFDDLGPGPDPAQPLSGETKAAVRLSALLQWLPLAGAALLVVAVLLRGGASRWGRALPVGAAVALTFGVLAVDLFRANMGYNTAIPRDHAERAKATTGAIRYLQGRVPNRFSGLEPRPGQHQPLQPDLAMDYGLYDARGYDFPVVKRFDGWWRATAGPDNDFRPRTGVAESTPEALRGMNLLSVSDLIQDPTEPPSELPGLELAYAGRDARVYRNENALPRAFLVGSQRTVPSEDAALLATLDPRFDARREAITERAVPGIPTGGGSGPTGTARLVDQDSERVVAEADADRESLLVVTDTHYPGWKATVDGEPAEIEHVNYVLRGVRVPAGRSEVEFRYEPWSWRAGWIVSLLALLAMVGAAVWSRRRRRA